MKTILHGGSGSGFAATMIRFPEQKFSVMCFCNAGYKMSPYGLATQVADIFLADQFKKGVGGVNETLPAIISISEKDLASLTGLYVTDPITYVLRFYMKDGKLMVEPGYAGPAYVLSPLSQNRFKVVGAPVELVFGRPVAGGRMQVKNIFGGKTTTLDAVQSETLTSAQLAEFAGKYISDELGGATYTLSIKDGKLILQVRNGITVFSDRGLVLAFEQASGREAPKDILLTPEFADAFITFVSNEPVILRFTRNQQNAVSGFTLSAGRVRGLRFNKLQQSRTDALFRIPKHPYTQSLLNAVLRLGAGQKEPLRGIPGAVPDFLDLPSGCTFHPRCSIGDSTCTTEFPPLREIAFVRKCACYRVQGIDAVTTTLTTRLQKACSPFPA